MAARIAARQLHCKLSLPVAGFRGNQVQRCHALKYSGEALLAASDCYRDSRTHGVARTAEVRDVSSAEHSVLRRSHPDWELRPLQAFRTLLTWPHAPFSAAQPRRGQGQRGTIVLPARFLRLQYSSVKAGQAASGRTDLWWRHRTSLYCEAGGWPVGMSAFQHLPLHRSHQHLLMLRLKAAGHQTILVS